MAQQNYPVHEQELLALVETLKQFQGILHGTRFTVRTNHKALIHLKKQRDLSPRQHRWLDILNEFDFEIEYIPGETNKLADALSKIYSDEPEGVVQAESEYVDDIDEPIWGRHPKTHPIYVDMLLLAIMSADVRRLLRLADKPGLNYKETWDRKSKTKWSEVTLTVVQEPPDKAGIEDESGKTTIKEELDDTPTVDRDLETAEKLFNTIQPSLSKW